MAKITTRKDGYQVITVGKRLIYLHRHIAEKHIPNPENKCCVNHIDGNRSNNEIENLEWVTHLENAIHARENKLWGQNIVKKRKLTLEQVAEIKNKYIAHQYKIKMLAEEYSVSYKTIWDVVNNKSYIKEYINVLV